MEPFYNRFCPNMVQMQVHLGHIGLEMVKKWLQKHVLYFLLSGLAILWKFHHFSVLQILRELSFGKFRSAKCAIYTNQ